MKPGWQTTEFWMALVTQAGAVIAALQGLLDGTDFALLMGAATAFYSTARGIAKKPPAESIGVKEASTVVD